MNGASPAAKFDVAFSAVGVASYAGWMNGVFDHMPQIAATISVIWMLGRGLHMAYCWFKRR